MATRVDATAQRLLNELKSGAGTLPDAHAQAILDDLHAQAKRLQPPPVTINLPPTQPPPAGPPVNAALGPHGRVIDPTTGQEFGLPGQAPHETPQPSFEQSAIEKANPVVMGLNTGKDALFRVLAWAANPVTAFINEISRSGAAVDTEQYTPENLARVAGAQIAAVPRAFKEAGKALVSPEIVQPEFFSEPNASGRQRSTAERYVRKGMDIVGGTLADVGATHLASPLVKGATGLLARGAAASGALEAPIPGIGKSLNQLKAEGSLTQQAARTLSAAEGKAGQIAAEGQKAIQSAGQTYRQLARQGVNLAGQTGGRRVNALDELVTHWIEAGTEGAKYGSRQAVLADAAQLAQTPEQAQAIQSAVVKIGTDYSSAWQKVGHMLEEVGYLKPGTVEAMGGRYAARMYHATSHNPGDIEEWLKAADELGGVSDEAVGHAQQLLGRAQAGGPAGFSRSAKARTLGTFAERQGFGAEEQASPVFSKSIQQQSRAAGRGLGLQGIVANPEMASAVEKPGWLKAGADLGFKEPVYLHPAVHRFLQTSLKPETINNPALRALNKVSNIVKANITTLNAPMVLHKIKFDHVLAEGEAAAEGLGFTAADVVKAAKARKAWLKGGQASAAIDALQNETHAFTPRGSSVGDLGKSLGNALGIETPGEKLLAGGQKLQRLTREGIGAVEQTYKIALTEVLAKKVGYPRAAQIAQEAISGEHLTSHLANATIAAVEKYGGIPFVTARSKAAPKMLAIALKNPDILLRYSGYRAAQGLAEAGGPEVQARQQQVEPNAIPLPGVRDRYGRPQFLLQNPLELNPLKDVQHLGAGLGGAASTLLSGAFNVDLPSAFSGRGLRPIVKPGEVPPDEAAQRRLQFMQERLSPPLLGRGLPRIGRALGGTTQFGGPFQEPESVTQAVLGALTGARLGVPETDVERIQRGAANIQRRSPNQQFLAAYMQALTSGQAKPTPFPDRWLPQDARSAREQYKNALESLKSYVTGAQGKPGDVETQARIRRLTDWLVALGRQYVKLTGQQTGLQEFIDAARAGQ